MRSTEAKPLDVECNEAKRNDAVMYDTTAAVVSRRDASEQAV